MNGPTLARLEAVVERQTAVLTMLADQVRALLAVNAGLMGNLGDRIDRDLIRRVALTAFIDEGPDSEVARVIEAMVGQAMPSDPDLPDNVVRFPSDRP